MTTVSPHYILRFPFRLSSGQVFANIEPFIERKCGNLTVKLKELSGWYQLTLAPFRDESEAIGFIPRVYAGLMWTLLHNGLSPEATLEPQSIHYSSDPQGVASHLSKSFDIKTDRVDAILEGSCPAIYQSNKEIRIITGGNVSLTLGFDSARSLDMICEAIAFPKSDSVVVDGKLQIALELYSSFFREASANARYLTLAMALEALAPEEMKPQSVIELIED